jgi:hypothetical protein
MHRMPVKILNDRFSLKVSDTINQIKKMDGCGCYNSRVRSSNIKVCAWILLSLSKCGGFVNAFRSLRQQNSSRCSSDYCCSRLWGRTPTLV